MIAIRSVLVVLLSAVASTCCCPNHLLPAAQVWSRSISRDPIRVDSGGVRIRLDPPFRRGKYLQSLCLLDNSADYLFVEYDTMTRMLRPRRPEDGPYQNLDRNPPDSTAFVVAAFVESSAGGIADLSAPGLGFMGRRSAAETRADSRESRAPGLPFGWMNQWLCFRVTRVERGTSYVAIHLRSSKPIVAERIEWRFGT